MFDGTWQGSEPLPAELRDFILCHPDGMGWSWADLRATPAYVRRFCWDILAIRLRVQADNAERSRNAR